MSNERGNRVFYVTATPVMLPQPTTTTGSYLLPHHALILVEGGDIRWMADGSKPSEQFGQLVLNGKTLDWTDPLQDFQSFIQRAYVVAVNGTTNVKLNISWQD